jgi:hypothetical protein
MMLRASEKLDRLSVMMLRASEKLIVLTSSVYQVYKCSDLDKTSCTSTGLQARPWYNGTMNLLKSAPSPLALSKLVTFDMRRPELARSFFCVRT